MKLGSISPALCTVSVTVTTPPRLWQAERHQLGWHPAMIDDLVAHPQAGTKREVAAARLFDVAGAGRSKAPATNLMFNRN